MNQAEHCWERENLQRGFVEQELAMLLELVMGMVLASLLTAAIVLELVLAMLLELVMGMVLASLLTAAIVLELVLAMGLELTMGMALLLTVVFFLELVTVEVAESPLF
jgi:hypothetical protein